MSLFVIRKDLVEDGGETMLAEFNKKARAVYLDSKGHVNSEVGITPGYVVDGRVISVPFRDYLKDNGRLCFRWDIDGMQK